MSTDPRDSGGYAGEGFLSRWSRRKRLPDADTDAAPATPAAPPVSSHRPVGQPEQAPAQGSAQEDQRPRCPETGEIIDEEWVASLPRIEDIRPGDDLSGFMRRGVPEALRRQALRTMWTTDPVIRDYVSPALDYAHDYNTPGAVVGFEPLTESELESARAMVSGMFSTPRTATQDKAATAPDQGGEADASGLDNEAGPIVTETGSDTESQGGTDDMPVSVRRSDAAAQQADGFPPQPGKVMTLPEAPTMPSGGHPAADSAPVAPEAAMLHRSEAGGSAAASARVDAIPQHGLAPRRRRGGGATPV